MRRSNRNGGFTMIELMIVVAIIGILASVAIPAFQNYQNRSRRSEAFANMAAIAKLEKSYFSEYSAYARVLGGAQPAGTLSSGKLDWDAAAELAYATIGFKPDGAVYYAYDVTVDLAQCPDQDCFTVSGYGDADSNTRVALVMYVQPNAIGAVSLDPLYPGLGLPLDPVSGQPRMHEVAINYLADWY